jgi:hypothetical protein
MDNIEEIKPDMVCVSAADYPRHWKLFVRYLSAPFFQSLPEVLLLTDSKFDREEEEKAKVLGVRKIIGEDELSRYSSVAELLDKAEQEAEEPAEPEPVTEAEAVEPAAEDKPSVSERVQCLFVDPLNGNLITGAVTSCGKNTFTFKPGGGSEVCFAPGEIIDSCTLKIDGVTQAAVLQVLGTDDGEIKLKVRKLQAE